MKNINFNKEVSNSVNNPETTLDELRSIEPILIENCKTSIKLLYTYYFITLILILIWFLIDSSIVEKVSVFDVDIKNSKFLLLSVPFVSIACYYITMSYMAFNQLIDAGLKQVQKRLYPNLGKTSILELTIYPSLIELESIKARLGNGSFLSTVGFLSVSLTFIFLPIVLNGIICFKLFANYHGAVLILPIAYLLILVKIISNFFFYFKQVQ